MRSNSAVSLLLALLVMGSDAWFWSWSGTTTLAPAVDSEGSGSPGGSGEGPLDNIATVGQEDITEETHRVQKIVQILDETTVAPQPTTTEPPKTAPAPGSIIEPGNGTSSQKGTSSSEASALLMFARNVSGLGAGHESKLVSDTEAGVWSDFGSGSGSESGVGIRPGTSWASAPEIEIFERSEQDENMQVDGSWLPHHKIDKAQGNVGTKSEESSDFSPKSSRKNKTLETRSDIKDLTSRPLEKPVSAAEVSDSEDANKLAPKNQTQEINQSPAGQSTAGQQTSPSRALHTSQALSPSQTATTASSTAATPEVLSSRPQVVAVKHHVVTSKMTSTQNAPQKSLTEVEPSRSSQFRMVALGRRQPAGGHREPVEPTAPAESPQCLLLGSSLPFCSFMVGQQFAVPNYLNQSSVEEVRALLRDWAWLLSSKCHHGLEWFFCLLLLPKCSTVVRMPCRSFCEVLKDSCWTLLDRGHLPVECQALPEEQEEDGYRCLSVRNQKGNSWFK